MNKTTPSCSICGEAARLENHLVKEMTLGTRETFTYQECKNCGYLELLNIPEDMSPYYAENYYSFTSQSSLKTHLKALRGAHAFGAKNPVGFLLAKLFGYPPIVHYLRRINAKTSWRILDVGCGQGIGLQNLKLAGFKTLHGIDPFLSQNLDLGSLQLMKKDIQDVQDIYDLIIFDHCYEHLPDQAQLLQKSASILADDGWLLIRMPIIGLSWKLYGLDWFGLHAPRHFSIHSQESFTRQTSESPFKIMYCDFDSDFRQNLGSKKHAQGIPTQDPKFLNNFGISPDDISAAKAEADQANRDRFGDQASFYLQKKSYVKREAL